jgi:preprotein translocase subunit SecF
MKAYHKEQMEEQDQALD